MDVSNGSVGTENSTISTAWADEAVFLELRAEKIISKIFVPCILAVGAFGNIASICVMRRIRDHNSSQHAILMALAVSDFLLTQTGLWCRLLLIYFRIDLRVWHPLMCKLFFWLLYATNTQSAWLVTCVTVQRAMSVTWPHKMRAVCTLQRTWVVVASIIFTACIINVHNLVGKEITSENECDDGTEAYFRFFVIWSWVDMFISSLIPSLCQIVCDVVLCQALFKAASAMSVTVETTSSDAADAEHDGKGRRKTASNITVLCLALSCTFLILTLPVCVDMVWYHFILTNLTPRSKAKRYLRYSIFDLMWFANSAVNFFLYCIAGTKFRREFYNWICCRSQRHSTASVVDARAGAVKGRKINN